MAAPTVCTGRMAEPEFANAGARGASWCLQSVVRYASFAPPTPSSGSLISDR